MTLRLASISVDLDEIPCYAQIHGLEVPEHTKDVIYRRCVPRLASLFQDEGLNATFFAIGKDLESEPNRRALAQLSREGHEIGNHTFSHLYGFSRGDRTLVREEIVRGMDAVFDATGVRPRGFRAPGYTMRDEVFDTLTELGVAYDSSVFPCPAYFGAKAAAIAGYQVRASISGGASSKSVIDDPRVLSAPADPYRIDRPYWRRGRGMLELPIGVTRIARLPYIGTSVVLSGEVGAKALTRAMAGRPLVNLELHGIDVADADEDGLGFLRPYQPDLRVSGTKKEAALRSAIGTLRAMGYAFVCLDEAADTFSRIV